jgi:glycine hydroxymethyltransferase
MGYQRRASLHEPRRYTIGYIGDTRLGMKENEMKEIAEFIKQVVIDKENVEKVKAAVGEFRKDYQKVHYCFENSTEAYKYIKIR